jgi:plastocyanin
MRRLLPALALVSLIATAGCGGGADGGGKAEVLKPSDTIGMAALRFKPEHAQVAVGQKVTWRNDDSVGHDVKADSGARFASDTFNKDGSFSWTPDKAGTVKYECTLHPGMDGTVDVVAR